MFTHIDTYLSAARACARFATVFACYTHPRHWPQHNTRTRLRLFSVASVFLCVCVSPSASAFVSTMASESKTTIDDKCVNTIRVLSAETVQGAKSGHPGAPMGCAPMAHVLWGQTMKFNSANPKWVR